MKLKYILGLIIGLILLLVYFNFDPNTTYFPKCPLFATTGIYCPGCGSQRALHDLLHLNLKGMVRHNLLFPFGILVLVYQSTISIINKNRKKQLTNILYNKYMPLTVLIVIIAYWILRNIPIEPFNCLAPR